MDLRQTLEEQKAELEALVTTEIDAIEEGDYDAFNKIRFRYEKACMKIEIAQQTQTIEAIEAQIDSQVL